MSISRNVPRSSQDSGDSLDELDNQGKRSMDEEDVGLHDQGEEDNAPLLDQERTTNLGVNEGLEALATESGKSNMKMAFMNMANSIIGAGIVGQAYAVRQAGLIGGVVLLIGLTVLVDWTIRLIIINAKLSGTNTFQATVSQCFGHFGLIAVSLAQGLFAFGGSVAFCVIIGDTIPHVVNALFPGLHDIPVVGILSHRNTIIVLFTLLISYPLALNRNISKLAKASGFALVSMMVIVLTVVVRGPMVEKSPDAKFTAPLLTFNTGILQGVSVIAFAFVCHHNSLLIFESLKTPTLDRFARVTHWSTGVSMAACMTMGIGGFIIFKDKTKGNILNNFPGDDVMANIARFCFGLNMLTTLPLEIFVCREVILNYMYPEQANEHDSRKHFISTTALVLVAMIISLFTCNLGVILELVGSTSASVMAFVLPPWCYLRLTKNGRWQRIGCWACIAFGIMVMVLSTLQSLIKLFKDTNEEHCVV